MKKILSIFLTFLLSFTLLSCTAIDTVLEDLGLDDNSKPSNINENIENEPVDESIKDTETISDIEGTIDEDEPYTSKEDVSLYIHTYDKLPKNYIKKKEAIELGWESSKGNLWDVTDEMSIGGDWFGNREKKLPQEKGRSYYECDINYKGGYREAERLVYSDDGLIYYTGDHYDSFDLLYGDE